MKVSSSVNHRYIITVEMGKTERDILMKVIEKGRDRLIDIKTEMSSGDINRVCFSIMTGLSFSEEKEA